MSTLLLRFDAPMQSWGATPTYDTFGTRVTPTFSGVVGLLACALGRKRTEPIDDLAALHMVVRTDRAGVVQSDYHSISTGDDECFPTTRFYLSDAAFTVAITGPSDLVDALSRAVRRPVFPLYLGRKAFPANVDLLIGVVDLPGADALALTPGPRRTDPGPALITTAGVGEPVNDHPVTFDPAKRRYAPRRIDVDFLTGADYFDTIPA